MPVDFRQHLQALNKQGRLVPYRENDNQRALTRDTSRRILVLKARQIGISTAIQARFFLEAMQGGVLIAVLAHDAATTAKLRRMSDRFYDLLPKDIRPRMNQHNATTTVYASGAEVTFATAGSLNIGRGGTYTRVHGSEVAFWKDASATMAGLLQGVPNDGTIILESTPNGAQGWFYERCMEHLDGDRAWSLHFFPWWTERGYRLPLEPGETLTYTDEEAQLARSHGLSPEQIKWRRGKMRELRHLFAQEYPEDARACFLLSGNGYFGPLTGVYTAPDGAEPQTGHRYVAGLDFGQANDYTVLSVLDATANVQVHLLRLHRLPWAEMRRQIIDVCRHWRVRGVWAEANSIGGPNIEALVAAGLPVHPFSMTSITKPKLMAQLHEALNTGVLKLLDRPEQRREMAALQAQQTAMGHWTFAAPPPEHDDIVIANALAWHGALVGVDFILFEV